MASVEGAVAVVLGRLFAGEDGGSIFFDVDSSDRFGIAGGSFAARGGGFLVSVLDVAIGGVAGYAFGFVGDWGFAVDVMIEFAAGFWRADDAEGEFAVVVIFREGDAVEWAVVFELPRAFFIRCSRIRIRLSRLFIGPGVEDAAVIVLRLVLDGGVDGVADCFFEVAVGLGLEDRSDEARDVTSIAFEVEFEGDEDARYPVRAFDRPLEIGVDVEVEEDGFRGVDVAVDEFAWIFLGAGLDGAVEDDGAVLFGGPVDERIGFGFAAVLAQFDGDDVGMDCGIYGLRAARDFPDPLCDDGVFGAAAALAFDGGAWEGAIVVRAVVVDRGAVGFF